MEDETFLTLDELARRWKVSKSLLYHRLSNGERMPEHIRLGRRYRFRIENVRRFEEAGEMWEGQQQ